MQPTVTHRESVSISLACGRSAHCSIRHKEQTPHYQKGNFRYEASLLAEDIGVTVQGPKP